MGPQVGCGERGDIHGVPQGLVTGGIDQVPKDPLVVLNAAALGVAVAEEDELLLLPGPKAADAFSVHLQRGEDAEESGRRGGERARLPPVPSECLRPPCFGLKLSW